MAKCLTIAPLNMCWLSVWKPATELRRTPRPLPGCSLIHHLPLVSSTVPTTCDCSRQDSAEQLGHFPASLWVAAAAHRGAQLELSLVMGELLTLPMMAQFVHFTW